jgi:dolichol-phosphate mannosyltransferase
MKFSQLVLLALDAIFSFSKWPIKLCLYLGLTGLVVVIAAFIYTIFSKFLDLAPLGWSSTMLSLYFLGAIQLTFLGVIGEYVYRIYREVQNRPHFFVKEIIE